MDLVDPHSELIPSATKEIARNSERPTAFTVSQDENYIAVGKIITIGYQDGSVYLLQIKCMDRLEGKEKTLVLEKSAIQCMKFTFEIIDPVKNEKAFNLFYATKNIFCCYKGLSKKNVLEQ